MIGMGVGLLALVLVGGLSLYRSFTISSHSMAPTLLEGDYVLASSVAYAGKPPQRGDVIVFRPPGRRASYIKRLIGTPGDRIQLKDGLVYLNGVAVRREKLAPVSEIGPLGVPHAVERFRETLPNGRSYMTYSYGEGDADNTGVYVVPAGRFFVLADNRDDGLDSRYPEALGGGYVRSEDIRGRADVLIALGRNAADAQPRRFVQFLK